MSGEGALPCMPDMADAPGLVVVGQRAGKVGDAESWRVLVLASDGGPLFGQLQLSPKRAEAIGAELIDMAAVCRSEHAALEQREREKLVSIPDGERG